MRKGLLLLMLFMLFFVAACAQKELTIQSAQSVQNLVSNQANYQTVANTTNVQSNTTINSSNNTITTNETALSQENITASDAPVFNRRCINSSLSTISCKWDDSAETTFDLTVESGTYAKIPGLWLVATGESGGIQNIKRPEDIMPGGVRTYTVNYNDIVSQIGEVKTLEVYPIEIQNQTEYACLNMRLYTIPKLRCVPNQPINVDNITQ